MTIVQIRTQLHALARVLGDDEKFMGLKLQQLFQYLRISAKYRMLDLEATRRELKYCQEHKEH